jgi:hypothetical protein
MIGNRSRASGRPHPVQRIRGGGNLGRLGLVAALPYDKINTFDDCDLYCDYTNRDLWTRYDLTISLEAGRAVISQFALPNLNIEPARGGDIYDAPKQIRDYPARS